MTSVPSRIVGLKAALLLSIATAACCAGCGKGAGVAPARGVVQVAGKPACEGRVLFLPVGGGKPAIGTVAEDGTFELSCHGRGDGATVASNHIVLKGIRCPGDSDTRDFRAMEVTRAEVEEGRENEYVLNVTLGKGWQVIADN